MYKVVTINADGSDAFEFLQGQLSNDLRRLSGEAEIRSAWCNPKGRVIWFGTVRKTDTGFAMTVPAATAELITERLTLFRFRAKVDFSIVDDGLVQDPMALIDRAEPFIGVEQLEQFTPHMLNLDLLDAISLDKGCYTGQEIVARTHYKGATKRRTLRLESDTELSVGSKISDGSRDIGVVLNVSGCALLAVVTVSKTTGELLVGEHRLHLADMPYEVT